LDGETLKIDVLGRHFDISDSVREYAESKVGKLERFYDRIGNVKITLGEEGQVRTAEIVALVAKGTKIVGEARGDSIYAAVDLAVDKMERQITRHKEKLLEHRKRAARE
jgi:putative sigma-54 modulation protein